MVVIEGRINLAELVFVNISSTAASKNRKLANSYARSADGKPFDTPQSVDGIAPIHKKTFNIENEN